jgi:hypothetical protein
MADEKIHVRFLAPQRTCFGPSRYPPGEGWIDVLDFNRRLGSQEHVPADGRSR